MKIDVKKADVIWSYIGVILSSMMNVITLPIIMFFLDGDSLGLWYVFVSIGSITMLFDFGFSVTFARFITYGWSGARDLKKTGISENIEEAADFLVIKEILVTCKRIYLIISLIAFFLMATVGSYYIFSISHHIEGINHIIAWGVFAIATFLNLYYNYYDSFLRGVGDVKEANQSRVYGRLIQLVLMVVLLMMGMGLLGLCIAYLVFGVVFRYLGKTYFYKYNDIKQKLRSVQEQVDIQRIKGVFKTVWYNAWRDGVVALSVYLVSQASVILCSLYLSLTETAMYSIGLQIATAIGMLSATLYSTYQPALQSNWIKGDFEKVKKIMIQTVVVYVLFYFLGSILCVIIGLPVLRFIKSDVVITVPVMIGILLSQFILRYRDCFTSYFSSTNRLIYMPAFLVSSIVCLFLSIVLLQFLDWKIWGLIIAQIVSQCIYNAWYWSYKAKKELRITYKDISVTAKEMVNNKIQFHI